MLLMRVSTEYPELGGIYAVHPGVVLTPGSADVAERMGVPKDAIKMPDTVELPAATFLWLTARNAEFLSGRYGGPHFAIHATTDCFVDSRYVQAVWDLNEVTAKKEQIVRDNLLVTKLAGPARSV